jgi:hypothetical protein
MIVGTKRFDVRQMEEQREAKKEKNRSNTLKLSQLGNRPPRCREGCIHCPCWCACSGRPRKPCRRRVLRQVGSGRTEKVLVKRLKEGEEVGVSEVLRDGGVEVVEGGWGGDKGRSLDGVVESVEVGEKLADTRAVQRGAGAADREEREWEN